jgi:hypothetical protein
MFLRVGDRAIAAKNQAAAHAEIELAPAEACEGGHDGVFHSEFRAGRERGGKPSLEVNDVVMPAVFAQFVGDPFLGFRGGKDGVEDFETLQEISEAPAITIHLHVARELFGIVSWQFDPELVPEGSKEHERDTKPEGPFRRIGLLPMYHE